VVVGPAEEPLTGVHYYCFLFSGFYTGIAYPMRNELMSESKCLDEDKNFTFLLEMNFGRQASV
jgi:hypothetical protein